MASRRSYPLPWRHACLHMENLPLAPLDIVIFLTLLSRIAFSKFLEQIFF